MRGSAILSPGRAALVLVALGLLGACGSSPPALQSGAEFGQGSTDSAIAGETLRCAADYPDSHLVFDADGTLSGRFAGAEARGLWRAPGPDRVRMVVKAGGITVRDTLRHTAGGWQGGVTRCS